MESKHTNRKYAQRNRRWSTICIMRQNPFSENQVVSIGCNIILESVALTKSWHDFKINFSEARAENDEFE